MIRIDRGYDREIARKVVRSRLEDDVEMKEDRGALGQS